MMRTGCNATLDDDYGEDDGDCDKRDHGDEHNDAVAADPTNREDARDDDDDEYHLMSLRCGATYPS